MSQSPASTIPAGLRTLLDAPALPGLEPEVRPGIRSVAALTLEVPKLLKQCGLASAAHDLFLSALLLWHDHLQESHLISQRIHNANGSFLHAVMHRREPDFSNSKYWWHRVGSHPGFIELTVRAEAFLTARRESNFKARLLPAGTWDPFAFVDACEQVSLHAGAAKDRQLCEALQQLEFEALIEHLCREGGR